jgi:transcriptional regulator with XRE-family HTH domain
VHNVPLQTEARVTNPIFGDEYEVIVEVLVEARGQAGLSQRQLAQKLGRSQSHVCMIEKRQRRVELVEFCKIARAVKLEPEALFARVLARIRRPEQVAPAAPLRRVA